MNAKNEKQAEKETIRLEAFSDGVYAIAITLLVLELKVPHDLHGETLATALLHQWPAYVGFLMSFGTIGIMWVNHHRLFTMIHKSDNKLLMLNLLLLLTVTIVPFPTQLLTDFIQTSDAVTAARIYSFHGFNLAVAYNLLWRHAAGNNGRLLSAEVDMKAVANLTHQYRFGPLFYLVCFALTFWSATACVVGCAVLAIFFAIPPPDVMRHGSAHRQH